MIDALSLTSDRSRALAVMRGEDERWNTNGDAGTDSASVAAGWKFWRGENSPRGGVLRSAPLRLGATRSRAELGWVGRRGLTGVSAETQQQLRADWKRRYFVLDALDT